MAYPLPVPSYRGLSSWWTHINRGTPSTEPGTDFYVPIGTPVTSPAAGTIWGYGTSIGPATGRWVGVNFDDGRSFRAMHFRTVVRTGGRVAAGEIIGYSGASGYGEEDWSWNVAETGGAHTHVTLWPTWDHIYGYRSPGNPYTIDFMQYTNGSGSGAGSSTNGFLMALSDDQQRQIYDALVKGGTSPSAYYTTDATINVIRTETNKLVQDVRDALKMKNSDGSAYVGYDMLPAIINQNSAQDKQLATILAAVQAGGLSSDQITLLAKSISDSVIAALPEGATVDEAAIARAVRDLIKAEPLG